MWSVVVRRWLSNKHINSVWALVGRKRLAVERLHGSQYILSIDGVVIWDVVSKTLVVRRRII